MHTPAANIAHNSVRGLSVTKVARLDRSTRSVSLKTWTAKYTSLTPPHAEISSGSAANVGQTSTELDSGILEVE